MLRTADDVLEALHSRKNSLGLSNEVVDELAGLTRGHFDKACGPSRVKRPNLDTLMSIVGALGWAIQFVDDPESRIGERWEKRRERCAQKRARALILSEGSASANVKRWGRTTPKQRAAVVAKLSAARLAKRRRRRTRKAAN